LALKPVAVAAVEPLLHKYEAAVPFVTDTVALPVAPLQEITEVELLKIGAVPLTTNLLPDAVQPNPSVTVTEEVPANAVIAAVVAPLDHK
jgi:hypothetical protein